MFCAGSRQSEYLLVSGLPPECKASAGLGNHHSHIAVENLAPGGACQPMLGFAQL